MTVMVDGSAHGCLTSSSRQPDTTSNGMPTESRPTTAASNTDSVPMRGSRTDRTTQVVKTGSHSSRT